MPILNIDKVISTVLENDIFETIRDVLKYGSSKYIPMDADSEVDNFGEKNIHVISSNFEEVMWI